MLGRLEIGSLLPVDTPLLKKEKMETPVKVRTITTTMITSIKPAIPQATLGAQLDADFSVFWIGSGLLLR